MLIKLIVNLFIQGNIGYACRIISKHGTGYITKINKTNRSTLKGERGDWDPLQYLKYSRGLQFLNCGRSFTSWGKKFHTFTLCFFGRRLPFLSPPWLPASPPLYSMAQPWRRPMDMGLHGHGDSRVTIMGPWPAVGHGGERGKVAKEAKGKGMKFFCLTCHHPDPRGNGKNWLQ